MEVRLQKWRNSDGIRIPSSIIKTNNVVELHQEDDKIVISKQKNDKNSLKERFATYKGPNLAKEFEWDEHRGSEIW
ncbi:MAG: AbrB/MazE/SpoVT family DNA-binding domain-containing protein [bacterium]|nr:AbrB/MazE/SpoVT family DNA-binding domain-containing protein [bacterium]